jgi:hypothetical protein
MKPVSDKILAQRMLQARADGGYRLRLFLRINTKGYIFLVLFFSALSTVSAFVGCWPCTFLVAGIGFGVFLRDVSWLTGIQRSWPFSVRITDWDKVQKIADEKPSA